MKPSARCKYQAWSAMALCGSALLIIVVLAFGPTGAPSNELPPERATMYRRSAVQSSELIPSARIEAQDHQQVDTPSTTEAQTTTWLSVSPTRAWAISPEGMAPYETILAALNLQPNQILRLKQLLVERRESGNDAEDLSKDARLGNNLCSEIREAAEASIDQEIESLVGPKDFPIVWEMLQLTPQLQEVAHFILPELEAKNIALTADQMLQLACAYRETYVGPANGPLLDRSAGFDPQTGLGTADRELLASAALFLKSDQLDILRSKLAKSLTSVGDLGLTSNN